MSVPSFFGNLFSELIPGGDCSSIEQDPHADPFDKEVCQQLRRFNDVLGGFNIEHHSPEDDVGSKGNESDPQSLRDSILRRPKEKGDTTPRSNRWPGFYHKRPKVDEDLDESIRKDPHLLDRYLKEESSPRQEPHLPRHHSSYTSVVITARPDGTYEERRTVRDAYGNEEVTVTYSDGQQTHTEQYCTTNKEQNERPSIWDELL